MTVIILIFAAVILIGLGLGAAVWFVFRRYRLPAKQGETSPVLKENIPFRLNYIAAPLVILLVSIALAALFYRQLPQEVGYHFGSDGAPDRWFSRETALALMVLPQFFLTALPGILTLGIIKLNILSGQSEIMGLKPQKILQLMGNVAVLPQVVLGFVMIDIFSYNAYQIHILPAWAFLLILGLVTVVLAVALFYFVFRARRKLMYQPRENK